MLFSLLKGTQTVDNVAEQAFPSVLLSLLRRDSPVLFALLYLVLRRMIGWAAGSPAAERSKDIAILAWTTRPTVSSLMVALSSPVGLARYLLDVVGVGAKGGLRASQPRPSPTVIDEN